MQLQLSFFTAFAFSFPALTVRTSRLSVPRICLAKRWFLRDHTLSCASVLLYLPNDIFHSSLGVLLSLSH